MSPRKIIVARRKARKQLKDEQSEKARAKAEAAEERAAALAESGVPPPAPVAEKIVDQNH